MLGAVTTDVGFGRTGIPIARRCFDPSSRYTDRGPAQAGGAVLLQQFLDDALLLVVFTFAEVVISNAAFAVDKIMGGQYSLLKACQIL